jgi:hypothetical protein
MASMNMRSGIRDSALSLGVFAILLGGLTTMDPRVQQAVPNLFSGGVSLFGDRLSELVNALWMAARYQSFENSPMLVFATVGVVLTIFMLRS